MRTPMLLFVALIISATSLPAQAGNPQPLSATRVQLSTDTNSVLCSLIEVTVLASAIRIKCHNYPPATFAVHNEHPFYTLPLKGQRGVRVNAVMDILMYAREHTENIKITYGGNTDEQPEGCDPDNCRALLTVGLVKQ